MLLHLNRIIKSLLKPVPDPRDRPTISNLRVSGSSHHQLPSYSIAFIKALRIDDVSTQLILPQRRVKIYLVGLSLDVVGRLGDARSEFVRLNDGDQFLDPVRVREVLLPLLILLQFLKENF